MAYEITGPYSYGPQNIHRPIGAESPAGPHAVDWPVSVWRGAQPQMAGMGLETGISTRPWWQDLIQAFVDPNYRPLPPGQTGPNWDYWAGPVPTYRVETTSPYCENLPLWVIGTAVLTMLITQK